MKSRLIFVQIYFWSLSVAARTGRSQRMMGGLAKGILFVAATLTGMTLVVADEQTEAVERDREISVERMRVADWDRLLEQLGSESYALRRQAFAELWQLGTEAEPHLNRALMSSDKQIAETARRLVLLNRIREHCDDIQAGSELVELMISPTDESLVELATRGFWELAVMFLEEHSAYTIRSRESFFQQGTSRDVIQVLVDQALLQSAVDSAWPVIARLVPNEVVYWTANHLQLPVIEPAEDPHDTAMQLFIEGRVREALEQPIPSQLKLRLATRGFQWEYLSKPSIQSALLGDQPSIGRKAAVAVLLEYTGDRSEAESAWREALTITEMDDQIDPVQEEGSPTTESPVTDLPDVQWEEVAAAIDALRSLESSTSEPSSLHQLQLALLLSGKVEPLELFLEEQSPEAAFDFFITSSDYTSAFRQLGLENDLSNLDDWIDRQVAEAKALLPQTSRNPSRDPANLAPALILGKVGSLLTGLGYREQAHRILEELMRMGRRNTRRQNPVWDRCILRWVGREEWRSCCLEIIQQRYEELPKNYESAIFSKLFSELGDSAWSLYLTAPAISDSNESGLGHSGSGRDSAPMDLSTVDHKLAISQLDHLQRCDSSLWGEEAAEIVKDWLLRAAEDMQSPSRRQEEDREGSRLTLAKIAHLWGLSRLALDLLQFELKHSYDSYSATHLAAKICLDLQQPDSALQYLNAFRPSPLDQHKDLAIRLHCLLALGRWEEAQREHRAHWMRMSAVSWNGDRSAGYRAAEDLVSDKKWEEALPFADRNFFLDRFGSYFFGFWEARQYSRILQELEQFEQSANVMRSVLVELLRPYSQTLRFFAENNEFGLLRYVAARERLSRAISSIEQGQHRAAASELEVAFRLQPLDIEAVISCYPLWRDADRLSDAESLFSKYETAIQSHLRQWPNDAMNLNNLAWMYSQCDRQLDEALILAEQAVALAPSSAVYLDTLAEVHFRRGDIEKAIELMRKCVTMDPREAHYRENLIRYQEALQPMAQ